MKNLKQWLAWQETLHPEEIDLGLERIRPVAERLHLLSPSASVVSVAGTNGKGSSIALLESITRSAGLRVGCYTSPHILRYNERIRIDGEVASDAKICEAFEQIDRARGETSLTYFEFGTLAALYLLQQQPLDLWILEVGLGGRLDAVNLISADVALLTTVDLDHQAWLGETREEIGREKAGIFRSGQAAVVGESNPPQSVLDYAAEVGANLSCFSADFTLQQKEAECWHWQGSHGATLDALPYPALQGAIQLQNSAAVLEVLNQLDWLQKVGVEGVMQGLRKVQLSGRFETIATAPQVVVDVSHNPQAAAVLADNLKHSPHSEKTIAVVGMLRDKEVETVIRALSQSIDQWMVGGLEGARGLSATVLGEIICAAVDVSKVTVCGEIIEAYRQAEALATPQDRILVFGSFYTVAAVLEAQ